MSAITVRSRMWTEAELKAAQQDPALVDSLGAAIPAGHPGILMPRGGYLKYGSTQPKKPDDAKTVFRALSADIKVTTPIQLLHWFLSADELSRTYIGNAYEKAEHLLTRIYDHLGYEYVAARLKERGINPDEVLFCVNDCGMHLNTDYSGENEFARSVRQKGLGPWPGVELGPVLDAQGGCTRFFIDLHTMKQRMEAEGRQVDLSGADQQTYIMFKILPRRENIRLFSFESSVPVEFVTAPKGVDSSQPVTTYNFIKPVGQTLAPELSDMTAAEIGPDFIAKFSAESLALQAFIEHAQIPLSIKPVFDHAKGRIERPIVIATQHNILQPTGKAKDFQNVSDYGVYKAFETDERRIDSLQDGAYQDLTRGADAVVLGPHSPEILDKWDYYFPDLFDLWCSLCVDKQVHVETFEGKPFFVQTKGFDFMHDGKSNGELDWNDPETEKAFLKYLQKIDPATDPWGKFVAFTHYLHAEGFVKQQPKFLFQEFDEFKKPVRKQIKRIVREAENVEIPEYAPEEFGSDRTDLPEIVILGSAGTRVEDYTEDAFDTGGWALSQGWHVRTGGGNWGVMGWAAQGAFKSMKDLGDECADYVHFSAVQMPRTLQFEGVCLNLSSLDRDSNKYLLVAPSFDARMRSLFRSNVLIGMAGGLGTYQEINRFIRLKEAGAPELQGKKMILVNREQPGKAGQIRVFDPFLAILPKRYIRDHLIVVNDIEAAKIAAKNQMEFSQGLGLDSLADYEP